MRPGSPGSLRVKWVAGRWVLRRRRIARARDPWFRRHRLAARSLGLVAVAVWAVFILAIVRLVAGEL